MEFKKIMQRAGRGAYLLVRSFFRVDLARKIFAVRLNSARTISNDRCDSRNTAARSNRWNLTSLICVFIVFSVTALPAQALVEQVAPIESYWNSTWDNLWRYHWPSSEEACQQKLNIPSWWSQNGSTYTYLGATPNATYYVSSGMLDCKFNVVPNPNYPSSAYDTGWGGVYPWGTCPTALPAYNFNSSTLMCERTVPDVVTCPIPEFPDINASDACTKSLEKGAGKDVDNACEPLDPEMVKQEVCLANKIRRLGIGYTEPSATVRTVAYQQHFVDLWKWHEKIEDEQGGWSATQKQVCEPIVAKVDAEWKKHRLDGAPSNSGPDAPHVQRKAVDINRGVVEAMKDKVSKPYTIKLPSLSCIYCDFIPVYIGDVQDYVNSPLFNPPPCKLRWGGRFKGKKIDPVHFDLFLQ